MDQDTDKKDTRTLELEKMVGEAYKHIDNFCSNICQTKKYTQCMICDIFEWKVGVENECLVLDEDT